MKKIFFSLLCFFSFLFIVNAAEYDVAKVTIAHHLAGINGKTGDATLDCSAYEVYSDGKLLFVSRDFVFYVPKYKDYLIKDVSECFGVQNTIDMTLNNLKQDAYLNFDKYALSKTYILDIKDDLNYSIYLKSDDDLYYTFDKMYGQITLPFGTYYIKNGNGDVVKEVVVDNTEEETLTLGEVKEEKKPPVTENHDKEDSKESSSTSDNTQVSTPNVGDNKENNNENNDNDNTSNIAENNQNDNAKTTENEATELPVTDPGVDIVENPQTLDNISLYIGSLFLTSSLLTKEFIHQKIHKKKYVTN